jgi:putative FmdB family regulatory protein
MPTYDFECEPCAFYIEIKQGFNDPSTHTCPICGKETLVKVFINPPAIMIRGEPVTIAQLADRNTQKMGKYELKDKNAKNNIHQASEITEQRKLNRRINKMTQQEKVRWIKDGD